MKSKSEIQKSELAESTWTQPISICNVDVCYAHHKSLTPLREFTGFGVICKQQSENLNLHCPEFT